MPFTLAHPAIVLPLKKFSPRFFSITALVIGSMSPDFEYFMRMHLRSEYSHTFLGLFLFCIPVGLVVSILFHQIIRNPLIRNLPAFLQIRFAKYESFNWLLHIKKHWLAVLISFLIGATSHILWDQFTHPSGVFVDYFPSLTSSILNIPVYKILQHASTFFGGLFILWFIYKMPIGRKTTNINLKYWGVNILLMCIIIGIRLSFNCTTSVGNLIVIGLASSFLALLLTSLWWKKHII